MATDATGTRSVYNTLSTTTVDTVTLQGHWVAVEVINREVPGGADLWVTAGKEGDIVATPSAALNDSYLVPAGTSAVIVIGQGASVRPQVKIIGSGNAYGVVGLSTPDPARATIIPAA